MAREALDALESAEIALGYKTYLDLISDLLQNKTVISSGMRKEVERCQAAIEHALCGRNVALISSGDAGIYGMAGLVLDICRKKRLNVLEWDGKDLNGSAWFFSAGNSRDSCFQRGGFPFRSAPHARFCCGEP